ncbi:MAG: hypothetical protein ACMXYG_06215 [Candidatus Woesearchaeota archaeon]
MISFVEANDILQPLIIFIVGVVMYAVFIFHFYRFLGKKDIIKLDLEQYNNSSFAWIRKLVRMFFYIIKYIIMVPVFIFFWFGVLTLLLSFLSKHSDVSQILLVAMAMISAIRITSYYNEALSTDLAKMLPFALLGVYIVDVTFFQTGASLEILMQVPDQWSMLIYYFGFVVSLEFILRLIHGTINLFAGKIKND